jgi:hypothetical protein
MCWVRETEYIEPKPFVVAEEIMLIEIQHRTASDHNREGALRWAFIGRQLENIRIQLELPEARVPGAKEAHGRSGL